MALPSPNRARSRSLTARGLLAAAIALALAASVALQPAHAAAAEVAIDLTDVPIERLIDIEVDAASRFVQKASQAPSAVRVITAQEIRDFGYRTLAEALAGLPGLFATYDRSYSYLGARGFLRPGDYNSRFLLLIDGVRVSDPLYDQAPVGHDFFLDMDLVERIEYVPGPGSSAYGSNAFFGVINVVTREPADLRDTEVRVGYGSDNRREVAARQAWHRGDGHLLLAASASDDDGKDLYFAEFDTGDSDGIAHGRDGETVRRLLVDGAQGPWRIKLLVAERDKDDPAASFEQLFDDPRSNNHDDRASLDVSWHAHPRPDLKVSVNGFVARYRYAGTFVYEPAPAPLYRDFGRADWAGFSAQVVSTAIARHKLVAGIDGQIDWRADLFSDTSEGHVDYLRQRADWHRVGFFVNDEFAVTEALLLNTGLRYDSDDGDTRLSPRVALIWNPNARTSLKAVVGEAFRSPNAYEDSYYPVQVDPATPDLMPERIRTAEFIAAHRLSDHAGLSVSVFDYRLRDLIDQAEVPESGDLYFRNEQSVRTRGAEVAFDYAADGGALLRASYSRANTRNGRTGERLENSPRDLATVRWSMPVAGTDWRLGIEGRYVGSREGTRGTVDSYGVVNANVTWRGGETGLELRGSLYNAFDAEYGDPAGPAFQQNEIEQDGRTFLLQATYRF